MGSKEAHSGSGNVGKRHAHALRVLARGMQRRRDPSTCGLLAQRVAHAHACIAGALALTIDDGSDNFAGPDRSPCRARGTLADAR